MAFKLRDNVAEISTTTGSGDIDLAGAVTGYNSFGSFLSTGDTTWAQIRNVDVPTEWLSAVVEYVTGNDLEIVAILDGTNGAGNAVSFSAGVKQVVCGMPAAQVLARQDITGTVSQSSGMPTGTIIERGSNANGSYVRFADGTQWCWHSMSVGVISEALSPLYASAPTSWTFPAAFSAAPATSTEATRPFSSSSQRLVGAYAQELPSTTGLQNIRAWSNVSNSNPATVHIVAVGRWF